MDHADADYLDAKRTVDDRARSRRVRDRLLAALPAEPRILDAGAGTGATVDRLVAWGVRAGSYLGVDRSAPVLSAARERRLADLRGVEGVAVAPTETGFRVADLDVRFEQGDALTAFEGERADLVVAASFLDLVPLSAAFDAFEAALRPGGLVYAPFTFDGGTIFQPDHPADEAVVDAYHDHIDAMDGRDVRAGRHALDHLRERPGDLLAASSSDWVVRPRDGAYPDDERRFLATILAFVADAVGDHPDADDWLHARRRQLADGELTYVAHQYDLCYRTPGPGAHRDVP